MQFICGECKIDVIQTVVDIAAHFNQSARKRHDFDAWQRANRHRFPGKVLHTVTPIKTRWHAYLDSLMRVLELWDRVQIYVQEEEGLSVDQA